ncbi:MAG TPA: hypothetical protein VGJ69_03560 [Pyrinomonadaceae bacterium]|jgi:hypothetical protein
MISLRTLLRFLIIAITLAPAATAQQINSEPTQLALEVHFYPKEAPAYQTVPAASPRGAWYARFGHVRGFAQPPGSPAVTAVDIKSALAEDGIRVWVSVFLGKLREQENRISSYVLHEGEKVTVRELAQVGVEPFEIKVVRLTPSVAEVPQFTSKAKSIEVVVMQPNMSTLPSYEVLVRNVSMKNVSALHAQVVQGGRPQIMSMPQGKEGQPLIVPSGTYQFTARIATRATPSPDGYAPTILPNQVIQISTAVFDDGTFEGDSDAAIAFTGFQKGRKIQLARVVDLFERSLAASDSASSTLGWLKGKVAALSLAADPASVQDLLGKFPTTPDMNQRKAKNLIEIAMKGLRDEVLNDVTQFQHRNRRVDPNAFHNAFHDWLKSSKDRYEAWFARL